MKKTISILLSTLLATWASIGTSAFAHDADLGALAIKHPWARITPNAAVKNSAAFFSVENKGAADKLISVTSDVARELQIHTMTTEAGVMKMREVKSLEVPEKGKLELKPGGYHIMLIGLKQEMKEGFAFPLKLKFEKAGEIVLMVHAEKPNASNLAEPMNPDAMSGHKH